MKKCWKDVLVELNELYTPVVKVTNPDVAKVGDIIARPLTAEERAKAARIAELNNRLHADSTRKADEKAAKKAARQAEKAAKKEANRKANAEREAARKAKKAAEAAAKKAYAEAKAAEKTEAEKEIAIGETPTGAANILRRREQSYALIDSVKTELDELRTRRDNLLQSAKDLKDEINNLSAALKAPMKSAKVRAKIAEKLEIEQKISAITAERRADQKILTETCREVRALTSQIRVLAKYGNAAVRPTIRLTEQQLRLKKAKIREVIRELALIDEKVAKESFQIPAFDREYFLKAAGLDALIAEVNKFRAGMKNGEQKEEFKKNALKAVADLRKIANEHKPIEVRIGMSRPSRITNNFLSMAMSIDTEAKGVRTEWINVEHGIQEALKPSWALFSATKKEGQDLASKFVDSVFELLDNIVLVDRDGNKTLYHGLYSSASHQKKEKLILCREDLLRLHEEIVWFGKTKEEILRTDVTGAEIWKGRANLARPIAFAIKTIDGQNVYLRNIMMVRDVKKTYHHDNAVMIGGNHNGKPYAKGKCDNEVIVGDGQSISKVMLNSLSWQGGGAGYKTMCVCNPAAYGLADVDLPEGKLIVCGDGCFKFDKFGYANWDEFAARMDELAERYPGINQVYALRQSEELDEEERIRKVSRSLLQQIGLVASNDELQKLADPAIKALNAMKSFEGLFISLAELGIPEEKRSDFAKLIFACPELLTNANVQKIAEARWTARRNEIAGNKFRTKGQYPYIVQDCVALLQIWLGGMDVNDPTLGVLKAGEASLVGVPEGQKVGALRYPANALTVKILVNRVMKDVFGECGNVAVLSIHDDILIIQDGDVDGDEMGILYDKLIIELIERLHRVAKPYVIVFEHGNKAKRTTIGSEDELRKRMYASLHAAKEFDQVGPYANLARDCVFLANIELKEVRKARKAGKNSEAQKHMDLFNQYILWMSAASTGAIMAIDQVKGNAIDPRLIGWLETIRITVHNDIRMRVVLGVDACGETVTSYAQPSTQSYVKNDFTLLCRKPNLEVSTDYLCNYTLEQAGEYENDGQGFVNNDALLRSELIDNRHPLTNVKKAKVTSGVVTELRANYFNRGTKNERGETCNPDADVFKLIRNGQPVGQMDLLLLYWRNMNTLEFRTQEKTAPERKATYYKMVRDSLIAQALSEPWFCEHEGGAYELGHEFTDEEKIASVVGQAVLSALEIGRTNTIRDELKGSFAKFVLSVFANDIRENVQRNVIDIRNFMQENKAVVPKEGSVGYEDTDFSLLDEDEVQYDYYVDTYQYDQCDDIEGIDDDYTPEEPEYLKDAPLPYAC